MPNVFDSRIQQFAGWLAREVHQADEDVQRLIAMRSERYVVQGAMSDLAALRRVQRAFLDLFPELEAKPD